MDIMSMYVRGLAACAEGNTDQDVPGIPAWLLML